MNRWNQYILGTAILAVAGCCVWVTLVVRDTLLVAQGTLAKYADVATGMSQSLSIVNRPCGANPCGLLAQTNKTVVKIGDAIVQTQLTERNATPHVIAAMDNLNQTAHSLSKTSDAATELTVALTSDAQTANQTIAAAQPVLASFQRSGDDLDSLLRSKAIYDTLDSTAATSEHIAGITGDLKIETDALVRPKTRKEKVLTWLPAGAKLGLIAACIATGTACP